MPGNVLDENVVILRFDNSDFEKNTKQSMDTLEKLKKSANDSSGKSLKGIENAANSINLSGLNKSIDTINKRFSLFGISGMAVINRLTNTAVTSAAKMITAIPAQAIRGGWQRALNIEQAQNLIEGLGFTWKNTAEQAEKGMKDVYTAVDNAVDKTRYALDEASIVASQLLSSGVENTDQLEESLKSITGLASVLNAEYGDIGRIFAQVAGQGRMMGDDLLQLQQRGIGAADEIAKYLNLNKDVAKAALDSAIAQGRQVKKMQEIREHAELTGADVREMVSAGAIDFEILSGSFRKFFEQAEKANDTYTGSLANLKSAINRIGESFMKIKLENFTYLFNALIPIFKRIKVLLDPLAAKVSEVSLAFTTFIVNGLINPLGQAIGAEKLFDKLGWAAKETSKKVTDANKDIGDSAKKSGKNILAANKEYQAARDIWYKGTYGKGQKRKNALEQLGISYKGTQAIINQFYKDGFKWDNIEKQLIKDYNEKAKASEEAGDKISDANDKQAKQYPTVIALLKGFVNSISAVYIATKGIGNFIIQTGKAILHTLSPAANRGAGAFLKFSEVLLESSKRFSTFLTNITSHGGKSTTVWNWFVNAISNGVKFIGSGILFAKDILVGFFTTVKDFFSQFSQTEGFNALKDQLKDLIGVLKDLAGGALDKVTGQLEKLSNIGASSNMERVVNFFSGLAKGFAEFIDNVRKGENPLKNFTGVFEKVKETLSFKNLSFSGFESFSSKNGIVASITGASKSLKSAHVSENFSSAIKSVTDFIVSLGGKAKNINVKDSIVELFDKIKSVDWNSISSIALKFGSLFGIIASVKSMRSVTDAAVGTFGSISGLFRSLTKISDVYAKKIKVSYFAAIATSVAILTGCVVALAMIPVDKLIPAVAGIAAAMGMLLGVTALLSSDKFDADKVKDIGIGFAAMGASLLMLGLACKVISTISGESLFKAGVAIVAFVGVFALASKIVGESTGAGESFMALAGAVDILVVALAAFAAMPWAMLMKGIAMIGVIMLELVIATHIAGDASPRGFVGMANAINILLPAITAFALMPFGKAMKGATVVCIIIAMLGVASRTASENAKSFGSIAALSVMIGVLTASLVVLSMIDTGKLLTSTLALTTVVASLSVAAKFAEKSTKGLLAISVAIGVIAASILLLVKVDANAAIDVANSLAILAASLSLAFGIFSLIGVKGSAAGFGGLAVAIGGVTSIVMALGAIRQIPGATWLLGEGKKFAQQLGDAIGSFFGSIVSGFGVAATSGLGTMAENISAFSEKIKPFLTMVKGIDPSSVQGAKSLADAIYQLTKADFVESLSVFSGVEDLASRMEELGSGFVKFSEAVDKVPEDTTEKSARIADIIKTLATSFNKIPKGGGIEQAFTGWSDVDAFVDGLLTVAKALGDNGKMSKGLNELEIPDDLLGENGKITKIAEVIRLMANATKKLPKTGGAQQYLTGWSDLGGMAEGILDFATTLGAKGDGITSLATLEIPDGLTAENGPITKICQVIAAMSEAAALIPESMGAKQLVLGNTTINEFASQLANAIPGLSKFITAIGSENLTFDGSIKEKIVRVAEAIGAMATASQEIPPIGGIKGLVFGGQDVSNFATDLKDAIPGLQDFASGLQGIKFGKGVFGDKGKLYKVVEAITAMAAVADALPESGGWVQKLTGEKNLGKFGTQLGKLLSSLGDEKISGANIDSGKIKKAGEAINAIVPAIQAFKGAMPIPTGANLAKLGQNALTFTQSMGEATTKGLGSKAASISSAIKSMGTAASKGASSLGNNSGFVSSGAKLGDGFVKGIKGKAASAQTAGKSLATKAKSGAGSVSLYGTGKDVGEGFVRGINAKKQAAYNAGAALGYRAKAGAKNAVNSDSPAKEFIKIGQYSGEGLVIGLRSYERKVYKRGEELGFKSLDGANQGVIDAIGDLSDPTIRPVVDLSGVRSGISDINNEFSRNRAFGINSTFENANYKNAQMMNSMVDALNKMNDNSQPTSNYFTVNVDGAENPEDFAKRFIRQIQLEMRTG